MPVGRPPLARQLARQSLQRGALGFPVEQTWVLSPALAGRWFCFMSAPHELFGYKVLAKIGAGAASEIFAVQDPRSKQVYALKHVVKKSDKDQRFLDQCEQEAAIGAKFDHPNIRRIEKLLKNRKLFKVTEVGLREREDQRAPSVRRKPPRRER